MTTITTAHPHRSWALAARYAGALALLAVGLVHLQQYLKLYSEIPTIGPLFLLNFAGATALGKYEGRLREHVLALKFRGSRYLADEFGRRLASAVARRFDLVVPVPMGRWKLLFRGYNAAALVAELSSVSPDTPVWTFSSSNRTASFWQRRRAQETAVHRYDAETAAGTPTPIDADLAVDGIDEFFTVFLPRLAGYTDGFESLPNPWWQQEFTSAPIYTHIGSFSGRQTDYTYDALGRLRTEQWIVTRAGKPDAEVGRLARVDVVEQRLARRRSEVFDLVDRGRDLALEPFDHGAARGVVE